MTATRHRARLAPAATGAAAAGSDGLDPGAFTRTLCRVPGPVTVVTTVDGRGRRAGFTATSFSSVSLRPPLVSVCLDKAASTHAAFTRAGRFMVNVLADGQDGVAHRFAASGADRFAAGDMVPCEFGLPGLPGASARVGCALHAVVDAGDHSILIGRVLTTHVSERTPLVYYDRSFARPVRPGPTGPPHHPEPHDPSQPSDEGAP